MRSFFGEAKPVSSVDDGQCCAVEWAGSLCEGCVKNKIVTGQKMLEFHKQICCSSNICLLHPI
jgi:hypothetical protein